MDLRHNKSPYHTYNMALAFWNSVAGRVRVLSYTAVTLIVILQTIVLGSTMKQSANTKRSTLLVSCSALLIALCSLRALLIFIYPPKLLLTMWTYDIPVVLALLSAVLSFTAPATSAFAFSLISSLTTSILALLSWLQ